MTIAREMFDKLPESDPPEKTPTVMVSGGFDPVHAGHIKMIRHAAQFGDVIVIANSDNWLYRKKGFVFMDFSQRKEILEAIKGVIIVDSVNDKDGTVCEAIRRHHPDFFANGGDRKRHNTPELDVCNELGIKLLWGIGGNKKIASSSDLMKSMRDFEETPTRNTTKHSDK